MTKTDSYLYLVGHFLVLCRASSSLRNFPTFLALDFPQLLHVLRKRLKFHIYIEQGLTGHLKTMSSQKWKIFEPPSPLVLPWYLHDALHYTPNQKQLQEEINKQIILVSMY